MTGLPFHCLEDSQSSTIQYNTIFVYSIMTSTH